jgi:DNA-binding SARP family transcriptional activator
MIRSDTLRWLSQPTTEHLSQPWAEIDHLIRAGAYDDLIRLLGAWRSGGPDDAMTAAVLNAVHQLALTGIQLRKEQDDRRRALQQADRLEGDTRRRIGQLLAALQAADEAAQTPPAAAEEHRALKEARGAASIMGRWLDALKRRLEGDDDVQPQPVGVFYWLDDFTQQPGAPVPPPASEPQRPPVSLPPLLADSIPAVSENQPLLAELSVTPESRPTILEARSDPPAESYDLRVYCLGPFRVCHRSGAIDEWTGHKSRSLFKYFLTYRQQPAPIEQLLDLFWRDSPPEAARRSLYQTIYLLRQTLRPAGKRPAIVQVNGGYLLNPELDVWLDSDVFLRHYRAGIKASDRGDEERAVDSFLAAEALYGGDFMSEDMYEDWPVAHRERARNAYLDLLDRLGRRFWSTRQDDLCIAYGGKLLDVDNCREDVHRRLMRVFARRGERSLALRQYQRCVEALREELAVDPLPETVELYVKILNNELDAQ